MTNAASTHIVVTVDEPEIAPEVVQVVRRLASPAGSEVTLLRVLVPATEGVSASHDVGPMVDLAERRARAELDRAGRALDGLPVRPEVVVGRDAAREILAWLYAHAVDLVVMAARDRRGLRHFLTRGVLESVRSASPVPVLAVYAPRVRPRGRILVHPAAMGNATVRAS